MVVQDALDPCTSWHHVRESLAARLCSCPLPALASSRTQRSPFILSSSHPTSHPSLIDKDTPLDLNYRSQPSTSRHPIYNIAYNNQTTLLPNHTPIHSTTHPSR